MKLWGGTVEAEIPEYMLDASDFREVPNSQEVFVGTLTDADIALIIDLTEPVEQQNLVMALMDHAEEAHRFAGGDLPLGEPLNTWTGNSGPYEVAGRIDIINDGKLGLVWALFRLHEHKTDVLVTCTAELKDAIYVSATLDAARDIVRNVIGTFKVIDPSLFKN